MPSRACRACGESFDPASPEKQRAGGLIIHCPDCSEETEVKYLGVPNAAGKSQGIEVLAFPDEDARRRFSHAWGKNKGMGKGKSSPLGAAGGLEGIPFKKVADFGRNDNHKGKD